MKATGQRLPSHPDAAAVSEIGDRVGELAARDGRVAALRYAMSATESLLRSPSDALRIDLRQRVFRPLFFSGGAGYQLNDFESVDYHQYELAPKFPLFRGPSVSEAAIEHGRYFCVIGGAQTFGRLVRRPWPLLLSEAIDLPVLNLSRGGAGPNDFLDPALIDLARRSRFVIIQVMSGRSVGCAEYPGGRRIVQGSKTTEVHRWDVLKQMWRRDPLIALEYVRRWNANYVELYRRLRTAIERPILLVWISHREPDAWNPESLLQELDWGDFPQLIGREVYEKVASLFEEQIKIVTGSSSEQPLSRVTGRPCPYFGSQKNMHTEFHYYPASAHHLQLASTLSSWASEHHR